MPNLTPAERQRMRDAIDALPEPTRSVYLAHLVDALDYAVIGDRESLSVREVEGHIAEAIVLIDRYLRVGRGSRMMGRRFARRSGAARLRS